MTEGELFDTSGRLMISVEDDPPATHIDQEDHVLHLRSLVSAEGQQIRESLCVCGVQIPELWRLEERKVLSTLDLSLRTGEAAQIHSMIGVAL